MSTNYPRKWSQIIQGKVPRLRHIVEPISIDEVFIDGRYEQRIRRLEPIWCHIVPLNLHQKQTGVISNFFGLVCNIETNLFDVCIWDERYVRIKSFMQPINNRYGYLFGKEISKKKLLKTDNIHEIDGYNLAEQTDLDELAEATDPDELAEKTDFGKSEK